MLQLTPKSTIYVAAAYVDFRKGIDGLAAICRNDFKCNPLNGDLFLFYNRAHNAIKIIFYDGQGFCLFTKRLSKGRFVYKGKNNPEFYKQICYRSLQIIINNGDPYKANLGRNWRSL